MTINSLFRCRCTAPSVELTAHTHTPSSHAATHRLLMLQGLALGFVLLRVESLAEEGKVGAGSSVRAVCCP